MDQVSSLLLTDTHSGGRGGGGFLVGGVGGCRGGTARLGGRQGAAGANRNWTVVSPSWGEIGGEGGGQTSVNSKDDNSKYSKSPTLMLDEQA